MNFLSRQSLSHLGIDHEIRSLETIAILYKHWPQLYEAGASKSFWEYLTSFEEKLTQKQSLLAHLDIDPASLIALARRIRKAYADEVPQFLQKLLCPLGTFLEQEEGSNPGLVRWKLYDESGGSEPVSADRPIFSLKGAQAWIDLEAGDLSFLPLGSEESLLRVGFSGHLRGTGVGASGESKIALDRDADANLDCWYAANEDTVFASAAAEALRQLPSPFSIRSIADAFAHGLRGLQLRFRASANASASVIYSIFEDGGLIGTGAGIDIRGSYAARRVFELQVLGSTENNRKITVQICRLRGRALNSTFGLGLEVDMSQAAEQVREKVIVPRLAEYRAIYETFNKFFSPGTLLEQECTAALSGAVERLGEDAALQAALRYALGEELDREQLQRDISAGLVQWFNSGVGIYYRAGSEDLPQAAAEWLNEKLPAQLPQSMRNKVAEEVRSLIDALQAQLRAEVQRNVDAVGAGLVDELSALNQRVAAAVDRVSDPLDKAFEGVREALSQIDGRIYSIVAKLGEESWRKIKLRILSTEKHLREREVSMQLCFDTDSEAAVDFYHSLATGRLEHLEALQQSPVSGVEVVAGSVSDLLGYSETSGSELSLLGISLGASSIVDSRVRIERDAAGNIAVQSQLAVQRVLDGIREVQSTGFASYLNLSLLRRSRSLPLTLTLTKEDERLEPAELEAFLGSLTDSGLLSPGAAFDAKTLYQEWQEVGSRYINARVEVLLRIDGDYLHHLMGYAADSTDTQMIADVLAALRDYDVFSESDIVDACKQVRLCDRRYREYIDPTALFAHFNVGMRNSDRPLKGRRAFFAEAFADTKRSPLIASVDNRGLRNARTIHFLAKSWVLLLRKLHENYHLDTAVAGTEQVLSHNALMAFCLHQWLKVKQLFLFQPDDEVSAKTIAFVGLLAQAAELPGNYPLSIAMSLVDEDIEPRLFA